MIFIMCWTCGYSTAVKGNGSETINAARRIKEDHEHQGSDTEIVRKCDLE